MNVSHTILIPLIPLAVFLLLGIFNQKIKPAVSGYIGVLGLTVSTLLSLYTAYQYFFVSGKLNGVYQTFVDKTVWMHFTNTLRIDMGGFNRSYFSNDACGGIDRIANGAYL